MDDKLLVCKDGIFPVISIIVPIYKAEKYLFECMESILAQTYTNVEIILVDDGSPDNSGEICDKYANSDPRIVVIHKENGGVGSARNAGLDIAKGQYIAFADSDDEVEAEYLSGMYNLAKDTNTDMAVCGFTTGMRNITPQFNKTIVFAHEWFESHLNFSNGFLLTSVFGKLFKTALIGNLRFDITLNFHEDAQFVCEYVRKCSKGISTTNLLLYHQIDKNPSSLTKHCEFQDALKWEKYIHHLLVREFSDRKVEVDEYIKYLHAFLHLSQYYISKKSSGKVECPSFNELYLVLSHPNVTLRSKRNALIAFFVPKFLLRITYKLYKKVKHGGQ